jgi:hypothetical protein
MIVTDIPPSSFAVAAYEAACLFNEDPADLFDPDCKSHARFIAIEVVKRAYPKVSRAEIARNMGLEGDCDAIGKKIARAKMAGFWNEKIISIVERALAAHIRRPITLAKVTKAVRVSGRLEESQHVPGAVFTPRKAPRIAMLKAARPSNVTAYLLGDPGAGSARIDRGETSSGLL